jgi:hypothetical protein
VVDTAPPTAARHPSSGWRASGLNLRLIHLPVHASWLNQIEIYFSIVQRTVLTPNDFVDLAEVEHRYQQTAVPFDCRSYPASSALARSSHPSER